MRPPTLVLLAILASIACRRLTVMDSQYADTAEAKRAQAFIKRRLPRWLPPESFNIRERTDLDTSEVWIRFDLPGSACTTLRESLVPARGSVPFGRPGRVVWWMDELTETVEVETIKKTGYEIHREKGGDTVALNCQVLRAFVYRNVSRP